MLACFALFITGCPTEVPYQAPEGDGEAPASETSENLGEAPAFGDDETTAPADNEAAETDDPDADEAPVDRYANPPKTPPSRMPWETADEAGADDGEVPDLFAKTDSAKPTGRYTEDEPAKAEVDAEEESYADFLGDAYAGLLDEEPTEEPAETAADEPPPELEPPAVAASDGASSLPFDIPPGVSLFPEDSTEPEATATPKLPTTTKPADAQALDDLWADITVPPIEPPPAAKKPQPTPPVEPPADDPPPTSDLAFDDRPDFADPVAPVPEELPPPPKPTVVPLPEPEWEPEPEPDAPPEPEPEPEVQRRPTPRQARPQASAAPGVKPLPSVPVLPFNTRHLAWLLGGKLALAELADLEGATPSEIAAWNAEVERLARELKIRNPAVSPRPSDPAARVKAMMNAASRAGGELSRAYGTDHSALLEIAVKSNTLLIVAADRPDLAVPVANAVRAAADDAMLPRFLWSESVKTLNEQPSADETADAVERLHQRVESFLR